MRRRAAHLALGLLAGVALAGCAGGVRSRTEDAAPVARPEEQPGDEVEGAEPARILSSSQVHPEAIAYLTPALVEGAPARRADPGALAEVVERLAGLGDARGEAAGHVNLGALRWRAGHADEAYAELRRAEALFVRAGDLDGLGRVHEWLGFMLLRSGEVELAAEHLAAAYQVFLRLEDAAATARVLAYGE